MGDNKTESKEGKKEESQKEKEALEITVPDNLNALFVDMIVLDYSAEHVILSVLQSKDFFGIRKGKNCVGRYGMSWDHFTRTYKLFRRIIVTQNGREYLDALDKEVEEEIKQKSDKQVAE